MRKFIATLAFVLFIVAAAYAATVTMGALKLAGSSSGSLTVKAPAAAGSNTLTLPAGTTDFSATGGTSQVVKQTSSGGALTVARLGCTDLSDSGAGCTGVDATSKGCAVGWDSGTTVAAATVPCMVARYSGTINSASYYTGGTGSPSFTAAVTINGTNVTSCNGLTVNSSSQTTTSCTAANTFSSGDVINVVISSPSGTPEQALVQVNFHQTGS